ncbi:hypothetical protein BV25DRAFT_952277 [Artomyces pyxidatus]|uniref:Uncharacterized protein n=1 Tax=Artomyces pyxidatus TaxID=48021 RepID=A0ACB8SWQ6_9AGAM|nr:hypothetical protein BV25DRAFT_952277 [Artomyces pyxidatus]
MRHLQLIQVYISSPAVQAASLHHPSHPAFAQRSTRLTSTRVLLQWPPSPHPPPPSPAASWPRTRLRPPPHPSPRPAVARSPSRPRRWSSAPPRAVRVPSSSSRHHHPLPPHPVSSSKLTPWAFTIRRPFSHHDLRARRAPAALSV